jgi:hypothetical protein
MISKTLHRKLMIEHIRNYKFIVHKSWKNNEVSDADSDEQYRLMWASVFTWVCIAHLIMSALLTWVCIAHMSLHCSHESVLFTRVCIAHLNLHCSHESVLFIWVCITHFVILSRFVYNKFVVSDMVNNTDSCEQCRLMWAIQTQVSNALMIRWAIQTQVNTDSGKQ